MNLVPLDQLSYAAFAEMVRTKCHVLLGPGNSLEVELAAVSSQRLAPTGRPGGLTFEQFNLVFVGPVDRLLPQHIYLIEAASIGRFELFLVPVGREADGIRYEATFNRPVKTP